MKVVRRPQAIIDLIEIADYIAQNNPETVDLFFDAFDSTMMRLKQTPKIGSLRTVKAVPNLRMWFVRGFEKNLIFYTENKNTIVITRIINSSRDYTKFFVEE